jgi:hypothetical protein
MGTEDKRRYTGGQWSTHFTRSCQTLLPCAAGCVLAEASSDLLLRPQPPSTGSLRFEGRFLSCSTLYVTSNLVRI